LKREENMPTLAELQKRSTLHCHKECRILIPGQSYAAGSDGVDRHNSRAIFAQVNRHAV